jgi:arylsulfatase A-like enzyme
MTGADKKINRRDFLKLAGLLPLGLSAPRLLQTASTKKNVLIVVFDAFSAYNISLHGYSRETTPNIAKLAKRAVVYHKHYAGGNFTTTGTATLLTGTQPWTHRALQQNSAIVESAVSHSIFNAFKNYYRLAYTHNGWVITFLRQFQNDIEEWIPREQLLLGSYGNIVSTLFKKDEDLASVGWTRNINLDETGYAYSLLFSHLYKPLQEMQVRHLYSKFPRGIPNTGSDFRFTLEQATDWLGDHLTAIPQPFLGYLHFLPPHAPYRTSVKFYNRFARDHFSSVKKPFSVFSTKHDRRDLSQNRAEYDEFILYVDREFGRFYNSLESSGLLDNTILVLTSDHGEINERGISGHSTSALYEPLTRVPLMIFEPGRKTRLDIHAPTSMIDLLPTLTHLADLPRPDWSEGIILPPFNPAPADSDRNIYTLRAVHTAQDKPIDNLFSMTLIKGRYKLHYYTGYEELNNGELIHLFDVESDPEEMIDLSVTHKKIADELLVELKAKLVEVNKPYA